MSEDTTLAILGKEMYEYFGSIESRRHLLYTFIYAFLLGSVTSFTAGFVAQLIRAEYSFFLSLASGVLLLLMVLFLFKREEVILGIPNIFRQNILIQKKNDQTGKEIFSAASSILKNRAPQGTLIEEKANNIVVWKKRFISKKQLCLVESMETTKLGGSVEVKLTYPYDAKSEKFSEDFLDDFYFHLKGDNFAVILVDDSRPFGKLLLQSRFIMIDKLEEKLAKG